MAKNEDNVVERVSKETVEEWAETIAPRIAKVASMFDVLFENEATRLGRPLTDSERHAIGHLFAASLQAKLTKAAFERYSAKFLEAFQEQLEDLLTGRAR